MVEDTISAIRRLRQMRRDLAWFQSKPRTPRIESQQKLLEQVIEVTKRVNELLATKKR